MSPLSRALTFLCLLNFVILHDASANKKLYIVYMGDIDAYTDQEVITANHELLASITGSMVEANDAIIHHYHKSLRGFSAMLTTQQAQQLMEIDGIVSVFESQMNHLQTTHSWDFLDIDSISQYTTLPLDVKSYMIIGIIDTGIWPESRSFNDAGLGPVPRRFRKECQSGESFTSSNCNRKIIGARFYSDGYEAQHGPLGSSGKLHYRSPRDSDGHGSFMASVVAGSVVSGVSLFQMANGTARGGAPSARIAVYKACWLKGCADADVLAAIDDAIVDKVDILSVSFAPDRTNDDYLKSVISIGAFHAFKNGVLTCAAGGNNHTWGSVVNAAPWMLTVAASSIDRELRTRIKLQNSTILEGHSLNRIQMEEYWQLISAEKARYPKVSPEDARFCNPKDIDPKKFAGKVLVCHVRPFSYDSSTQKHTFLTSLERVRKEFNVVKRETGYRFGVIWISQLAEAFDDVVNTFPTAVIGEPEGSKLLEYMSMKETRAKAKIYKTETILGTKPAPQITAFSARGPGDFPGIIKPDIAAPGDHIVAAWSPVETGKTGGLSVDYKIISGTSVACPHIAAIAAILKSIHPDWSPAALMSALMTTASISDNTGNPITRYPKNFPATPFDYGSGHVNATAAVVPGLVYYDFDDSEVLDFLCGIGFKPENLRALNGRPVVCSIQPPKTLNYASFSINNSMKGSLTIERTLTYDGNGAAIFTSYVESPECVSVTVFPPKLKFAKGGQRRSFTLDLTFIKNCSTPPKNKKENGGVGFVYGALTWSNSGLKVRSPIAIKIL